MHEKHYKKPNQECKQTQSLLLNFCNIFDLMISRTEHGDLVFKPDFDIFSYDEQLRKIQRNFIDKFLLSHTSLISLDLLFIIFVTLLLVPMVTAA